jgi:hypothetical protein
MCHRHILLGSTSRVKAFLRLSLLIYLLAFGLLTYAILVMLGKVQ